MGGSSKTETSQTTNPWAPAQGNLMQVLQKASNYGNNASMWAPTFSNNTQSGITQLGQLGGQGSYGSDAIKSMMPGLSAGFQSGIGNLQATANGDNLNGNSYFRDAMKGAMSDAAEEVQRQMSGAGRIGSGYDQRILSDRLGRIATDAYSQNYNTERGYQSQAANTLAGMGMSGANLAGQVDGLDAAAAGRQLAAGQLQDAMAEQTRMAPVNATNWQAGLATQLGKMGGTSNGTSETTQNPGLAGMIGGGLMTSMGLMSGLGGFSGLSSLFGGGYNNPSSWNTQIFR